MSELIYLGDSVKATIKRVMADDGLQDCGLTEENVKITLESFKGDELATAVFLKKYALRDKDKRVVEFTLEEAKDRWAKEIVSAEKLFPNETTEGQPIQKKNKRYFRELYEHFLPAGRQMFALGNKALKNLTYTNCYVSDIEDDSIEGIFDCAKKLAKTYSYGGGIGTCLGTLRPKNSSVSNSAKFSTGSVSFMELYSLTTRIIGQFGRRGALMLTMPVNHPDIEDFIEIKHNNKERVKHANVSVKLTDEFMNAVMEDKDFELSFATPHETISKTVKAKELWGKITQAARDSAEPGLMFWDEMVRRSPSEVYERLQVHATNPCGEQILEKGGACVLSSLLLHTFVKNPFTPEAEFDFELFEEMTRRGVRHLDNVVELNLGRHALQEQEDAARLGRRIGLGLTGLADLYAAMNLRYNSDEAMVLTEKVMRAKMEAEYNASIDLAIERGSFELYDPRKHFTRGFCADLPEEIQKRAKKYGLRNVAISTVAPNGSLSIIAQCSGGIEPIFCISYQRFVEMGGKRRSFVVKHPGLARYFEVCGKKEELDDRWVNAHEVDHKYRVRLQGLIQKYIDASISSTINLPRDVSVDVVREIYIDAWKEGLKGITVYREGSREGVLVTDEFANQAGLPMLDTAIKCVRAEGGDKFYIMVSYKDQNIKDPYQVFVLNYKRADKESFVKTSNALAAMLLEKGVPQKRIDKYSDRSKDSLAKITRFISLSMKTGNLDACVEVLDRFAFAGTLVSKLYDILKISVEANKTKCPACGSTDVRMEEGCSTCRSCGHSGCG